MTFTVYIAIEILKEINILLACDILLLVNIYVIFSALAKWNDNMAFTEQITPSKLQVIKTKDNSKIVSHLPGGHLPPPNSDISPPPKKNICQEDNCHPQFFFFSFFSFLAHFFWLFWLTAHGGHQGWEGGGAWWGVHGAHQVEGAWGNLSKTF